ISNFHWLSRQPVPPKSHSSLVISFVDPQGANEGIKQGIAIDGRLLRAERFRSLPTQCYNCHRFGHIARYCHGRSTCGRC
ncbi:hypothetical protein C8Q78DRAFT_936791, partial [Trametes maxima]